MFEGLFRLAWLSVVVSLWLFAMLSKGEGVWIPFTWQAPKSDARPSDVRASILVYHRFGPVVADSMTVRTATFRWQLEYLREHGCSRRHSLAWRR